jgi:hypothetical protein
METTTLYRPVGAKELALIHASGDWTFPPRLPCLLQNTFWLLLVKWQA